MPTPGKTAHKLIQDTALGYVTNSSIISTEPQFIGGNNILTGLRQWVERRPGFSSLFDTTQFKNVQRQWLWRRWTGTGTNPGAFVWMVSDLDGTAKVYKKVLGTDSIAQLLFTSSSAEPFDFVTSNNNVYFGNGTDMKKYDSVTLKTWGIASPITGPSLTLVSGSMNVFVSWCYLYTYTDEPDGHESSSSPISACSGLFSSKSVQVGVVASANPRVTNIRVYRTPDGGAQNPIQMQEISGSPFPNLTQTITDSTPDTSLGLRAAPAFLRNDPPPPSKGMVWSQGRVWSFLNNKTFYSGFEEISNGVPEECWPSGLDGNNYPWDNEVTAHAPLLDGVAVFTPERIYKIEGDSLDTFRRYTLLDRRGTRSRTTVAALGGSVAWLDTSSTIWISDIGEVGLPIRPDLNGINPSTAYMAIHVSGIYHWLCLLDGATGRMFVFDLDRRQWLPPWIVGNQASALMSGESSVGVVDLLLARNQQKVLKIVSGTYTDDSNPYTATIETNMYWLTPDGNPSWEGNADWMEVKTDTVIPKVSTLTDDNPDTQTFTLATGKPSPDVPQGKALLTTRYNPDFQRAQMLALKIDWPAEDKNFHLYSLDVAFHPIGD